MKRKTRPARAGDGASGAGLGRPTRSRSGAARPGSALFVREGRLRMLWAAPAALALYAAAAYASARGLEALRRALFAAWGVSARALPYAPGWMRAVIGSWGTLAAAVQGLACLLAAALCARLLRGRPLGWRRGHILPGAGIGSLCALLAFAVLRLTDSVRSLPGAGTSPFAELAALCAAVSSALAPEALVGGFFWPEARRRLDARWCVPLFALLDAAMYALRAPATVLAISAVCAMALACAVLYERRGWLCAAALRAAWHFVAYRVCGFSAAGAPGMFCETFPAARDWLSGGDLGLEAGAMTVALFLAAAAFAHFVLRPRSTR